MASGTSKRPRLVVDVTPDVRRRVKARAALDDMTVNEWVLGLIMDELEEEDDIRVALDRLQDSEGSATFTCGTQLSPYQRVHIVGTEGRIAIEIPFNAPPDRPCRLWLQRGSEIEERTFKIVDQYALQGDLFSEAIRQDKAVPTPLTDAVNNMKVIDALRKSHSAGRWESV